MTPLHFLHNIILRFPLLGTVLQLSLWLAVLAILFVPLERFFAVQAHKTLRKGLANDLFYYFLSSLLPSVILSLPIALLALAVKHLLPASLFAFTASLPFWAHALLGLVAGEAGYYWGHRWSHQIPYLWRFHSLHHSAEEMDFLVNTRSHPLDMVFTRFCGVVPMYVLGLAGPTHATGGSAVVLALSLVGPAWGFFVHSNLRLSLGPLEWLVSTPKFHHWHHTKTGAIDHNYASMLPCLDRLFRTHNLPKEWPESYGIEAAFPSSIVGQLTYPWMPSENALSPEPEEATVPLLPANGTVLMMPPRHSSRDAIEQRGSRDACKWHFR